MKLHKFCAKCGKPITNTNKNYSNYLCDECSLKIRPNYKIPKKITLQHCIYCGAFSLRIDDQEYPWQYQSIEINDIDFLIQILRSHVFLKIEKKNNVKCDFLFENIDLLDRTDINFKVILKSEDNSIYQEELILHLRDIHCPYCAKKRGGRFDAIVQIRIQHERNKPKLDEILAECLMIEEQENFKNLSNFISKLEKTTNGFDLKVSTNAMARVLIAKLRMKYRFELKISKKLIGVDPEKGSDLYRQSTLLRLIPVEKKDRILFEGIRYSVKNISKNRIILQNINGGKIKQIKFSEFQSKKWQFLE
ncbi:MAG: NMD3-related protein [Promethearchaeota archaeon]